MTSQSKPRHAGMDHLRASAILLVLFFHYRAYYGIPASLDVLPLKVISSFGWVGVDLFFVLSGFLIAGKLFEDARTSGRVRIGPFCLNRVFRILPAYFAALALYYLGPGLAEGRGLQPLWRFLTFTQNLHMDLYANSFSHSWSLAVEEHFYLLFPLLLFTVISLRLQRFSIGLFLAVFLTGLALRYLNWSLFVEDQAGRARLGAGLKYLYYPSYTRLDGLLVGVGLAALCHHREALWQKLTALDWLFFPLGCLGLAAAYNLFGGNILSGRFTDPLVALFGFPLVALSFGFLLLAVMNRRRALWSTPFWPSSWIALSAYSTYLVHKMTNHWLNTNLDRYWQISDEGLFAVAMVAGLLAGGALYLAVERPFLKLRDRLLA
ncbi:acyltransferase family protein [Rhodovibrionaceae bacterium A322]